MNNRFVLPLLLVAFLASTAQLHAQNNCLNFSNNNQYAVAISDCTTIPLRNLTIEFWFRTRATGGLFGVVGSDPDIHDYDRCITIQNGSVYHYLWANQDGTEVIHSQDNSFADGNWHHCALVLQDNQGQTMYLDGQQQAHGNLAYSRFNWAYRFVIGYSISPGVGQVWLSGDMDEVRIWSIPKTVEQIRDGMRVMMNGDEEGLVAYYRLDEGQGQTSADESPNDNPMRLGTNANQDNQDPRWLNEGAPVYGAIGTISSNLLNFLPLAHGQSETMSIILANLADQNDELHTLSFQFTDLGQAPNWLTADPAEGHIAAGEQTEITFTAAADDIQPGQYQRVFRLTSNGRNLLRVDVSASLTISAGIGRIYGQVTDARDNSPVAGVAINAVADYDLSAVTDEEGRYDFPDRAALPYVFRVTKPDFLPIETDPIDLQNGEERELNFSLLHSVCSPHPDQVNVSISTNDQLETALTIANPGNGPLTWMADKVFPQEHVAEPWALRQAINVGAGLHDDRIEGVAFDGEHFYFAGANAANPNTIYITDRDGNETNHYTQLGASQYGMKDLEWDGELLWGAGYLQNVYGFTPEGDSVISFQTAYNPTGNIAYDSDEDLLWVSGTTSNISAYDRQGHAANRTLNRKGLKIYGLSYWPEDPDGYNLYIFDQPAVGLQMVHKMNTRTNDTLLVYSIPTNNGEAPSGIFISNLWDPYSWVMLSMQNISPNNGSDRLAIWQLGQRTDWVLVSADNGIIPAGESTDLTIAFNSAGMPVDQHFDATLHITHDGVGSVTDVPIVMNVTGAGGMSQRNLGLAFGWNLISVNVTPQGAEDFTAVVQPLVDAGLLIMAKDGAGNFYRPGNQFNNINGWSPAQSYWLKMSGDAQLSITGEVVAADAPIDLTSGWNNVSYLPRQPIEAPTALSGLADNLTIARDGFGRFYLPAYHFSDMGQMAEGAGYQLRVREAAQLVYSLGGREASLPSRYSPAEVSWLNELHPTASMHNLLVKTNGMAAGTRLEAITPEGLVAGRGVVGTDGLAGLTLWGDDPATEVVEGFKAGEEPTLRLSSDPNLKSEILNLKLDGLKIRPTEGELAFTDGGWGVVEIGNATLPSEFSLTAAYPNPFNSTTRIGYSIASEVKVKLGVYDLAGRQVVQLFEGPQVAGVHNVIWNSDGVSTGIYICRLQAGSFQASAKLILLK